MTESTPSATTLADAERAELLALRGEKKHRQLLIEARRTLKEAGVYIKAKDLVAMPKSQWPVVISLATGNGRRFVSTERQHVPMAESTSGRGGDSAVDIFKSTLARAR